MIKTFNELFLSQLSSLLADEKFQKICCVPVIRVYDSLGKFSIEFDLSVNWYDYSDLPDFGQKSVSFFASNNILKVRLDFKFSDSDYE